MKILACLLFIMVGCGNDPSGETSTPEPSPLPPKSDGFAAAKVVIDEQCAVSGCHAGAGFTQSGPAFKNSTARQRINSGNMPKKSGPNYAIYNSKKKQILLEYLTN